MRILDTARRDVSFKLSQAYSDIMSKKPSGTAGHFSASTAHSGELVGQHVRIDWPTDAKEIERKILGFFIREMEKTGAKFLNIVDGGTEELDFLLTLPRGKCHLELMEAVVPQEGEIPFQPGNRKYFPIPYCDAIFDRVSKKIAMYGMKHEIPIDLLIYITHEQYSPNNAAIQVLRRYFLENAHPFQYVFFLIPHTDDFVTLEVLFNTDSQFNPPPLNELEGKWWINGVSSEADVSGNAVQFHFSKDLF